MVAQFVVAGVMLVGGVAFAIWAYRKYRARDIRLALALAMLGAGEGAASVLRVTGLDKAGGAVITVVGLVMFFVGAATLVLTLWAFMYPPKRKPPELQQSPGALSRRRTGGGKTKRTPPR